MNAQQVLTKWLPIVTPKMHKVRRESLMAAIESGMNGAAMSVTLIGRNLKSDAKEKHQIKRVDRLCSNVKLHQEQQSIYQEMVRYVVGKQSQPIIQVDWSDMDARKENFLIRASLAVQGRSLTLYEEVHGIETKEKPLTHKRFMLKLKRMLANECRPIIVTDAGFQTPWFKLIKQLGWDYVGRVRNRTLCRQGQDWKPVKQLYALSNRRAKDVGVFELSKSNRFVTRMVTIHRPPKGRKDKTALGDMARRSKRSLAYSAREREPWLLATSLSSKDKKAKDIVKVYGTRMQIEESFRDMKTGLRMNESGTRKAKRLGVLLLITALTQFILNVLGLAVKTANKHWQYQANTVKNRRVLSNQYIGLRAYKDNSLKLLKADWLNAFKALNQLIKEPEGSL